MLGVNVSGRQLGEPGFARSVHQTLKHSELPVELLALEIAEGVMASPDAAAQQALRELDALGVGIVLDDFGTGHSSLRWLKDHPRQGIKIDAGFVSDLGEGAGSNAVVAALISMASALGCNVTAQGVDTDVQLAVLRALGCVRGQGAALGSPVAAEGLVALTEASGRLGAGSIDAWRRASSLAGWWWRFAAPGSAGLDGTLPPA
jgi:EAL domain-containing protein (putative c-di-GMP-specific phosphodiesterase class I)